MSLKQKAKNWIACLQSSRWLFAGSKEGEAKKLRFGKKKNEQNRRSLKFWPASC